MATVVRNENTLLDLLEGCFYKILRYFILKVEFNKTIGQNFIHILSF